MGPFRTEDQARKAAHSIVPPSGGFSILTEAENRQMLGRVLESAGVEMGRYDDKTAEWLAGWTDATCGVVAGWITRAREAGKREGERRS
jgi:hypothetical protein